MAKRAEDVRADLNKDTKKKRELKFTNGVRLGAVPMIKQAVEEGVDVNCRVFDGHTVLHYILDVLIKESVRPWYEDTVETLNYLVKNKLDIYAINPDTNQPYVNAINPETGKSYIAEKIQIEVAAELPKAGYDPVRASSASLPKGARTSVHSPSASRSTTSASASAIVPKSAGYALGPASACAVPGVSSSSAAIGSVSVSSSSSSASSAVALSSASRAPVPMAWAWSQSCSAPSASAASSLALPAVKKPMFSDEEDEEVENYIAHLKELDTPDSRSKVEELEGFRDTVTACLFSDVVYLLADNGIYERKTLLDILAKAEKNKEDAITPETRVKFTKKDISEQIPRMILASAARGKQDAKRWKQAQDAAQKDQDASSQEVCQL